MLRYTQILLSAFLLLALLLTACTGSAGQSGDTTAADTAGDTDVLTRETDAEQTDAETLPEETTEEVTEPVMRTVSFVNSVWETVPSVTVADGNTLQASDVILNGGTSFAGDALVYPIPDGETFNGDFSKYTPVKLSEYVVTGDAVLALDLRLDTKESVALTDTSVINYYGRNYVTDGKATFLNTSSGFEVRFCGTKLTASFTRRGNGPVSGNQLTSPSLLRIRVYLDGDMSIENSKVIVLDGTTDNKEVVLAEFESAGYHTVLVRKMNYDYWGYLELRSLSADNGFCKAPAMPEKKILVYGDSITVGFGIEYAATGETGGDVPQKEDGTRTYAALLADYYGAQLVEWCNSGVSIGVPCWRERTVMKNDVWKQYAYFDYDSDYDMTQYVPDLIICNLGTNDNGGLANGVSSFGNGTAYAPNDYYTAADLEKAYLDFITTMKGLYPDADIIMAYGMMGTGASVQKAIKAAIVSSGFDDVYYCNLKLTELSENAGHPTLKGNQDTFNELLKFINKKHIEL